MGGEVRFRKRGQARPQATQTPVHGGDLTRWRALESEGAQA